MPIVPLDEILKPARQALAAARSTFSTLTMGASACCGQERSTSRPDVGPDRARHGHRRCSSEIKPPDRVPVSLHLDHCLTRAVITECLARKRELQCCSRRLRNAYAEPAPNRAGGGEARSWGAHVEGEIESIRRVEDEEDRSSDLEKVGNDRCRWSGLPRRHSASVCLRPPSATRTASTATAGGRVEDIVIQTSVPIALHGGVGAHQRRLRPPDLLGCAEDQHLDSSQDGGACSPRWPSCGNAPATTRGIHHRCSKTRPRRSTPSGRCSDAPIRVAGAAA